MSEAMQINDILYYCCHTKRNTFYFNLKVLKTKVLRDAFLILKEEFSRSSYFDDIQTIIDNNNKINLKPIELIGAIIQYLSKLTNNFLFALDQFKDKYIYLFGHYLFLS